MDSSIDCISSENGLASQSVETSSITCSGEKKEQISKALKYAFDKTSEDVIHEEKPAGVQPMPISNHNHRALATSERSRGGGGFTSSMYSSSSSRETIKPADASYPKSENKNEMDAHLVVAALIATLTFAAIIAVPGGYRREGLDEGTPFLIYHAAFQAFVITDTLAFVLSLRAIAIYFGIVIPEDCRGRTKLFNRASWNIYFAIWALVIAFCTGIKPADAAIGLIGIQRDGRIKKVMDAHLVVAALIATVTFAAIITMPGGYRSDGPEKGTPFLIHQAAFQSFVITDTLAFVSSIRAIAVYFGIARSKDRRKLSDRAAWYIYFAIRTLVIAFCTGAYVVLRPSRVLSIASCCIGISFFVLGRGEEYLPNIQNIVKKWKNSICGYWDYFKEKILKCTYISDKHREAASPSNSSDLELATSGHSMGALNSPYPVSPLNSSYADLEYAIPSYSIGAFNLSDPVSPSNSAFFPYLGQASYCQI